MQLCDSALCKQAWRDRSYVSLQRLPLHVSLVSWQIFAEFLSVLLHVGASIAASPLIALSLLAPEYQQSFAALLIGFALSETWRAPAAVLVKDVSPPELGATGSALHLSIRNLVGGCGPLSKPWPHP